MIHRIAPLLLLLATATLACAKPDLSNGRRGPTPYDPYRTPVDAVLSKLNGGAPDFESVAALVRQGFGFRYTFETPYLAQSPKATEARRAGDCKAKSLWVASRMNDKSLRYVIGRARPTSTISHAWLMWKSREGRWWVLDPTNAPEPIAADRVPAGHYVILYSYAKEGSYCHAPTRAYRDVAGRN